MGAHTRGIWRHEDQRGREAPAARGQHSEEAELISLSPVLSLPRTSSLGSEESPVLWPPTLHSEQSVGVKEVALESDLHSHPNSKLYDLYDRAHYFLKLSFLM